MCIFFRLPTCIATRPWCWALPILPIPTAPLQNLDGLSAAQLRRLLTEHLTKQKLGLYWEASAIERDAALNANIVLPRLIDDYSHGLKDVAAQGTPQPDH